MTVILTFLIIILPISVAATEYIVDKITSKVLWHLYIDKGINLYCEIPIIDGKFSSINNVNKGVLRFSLSETKSYELNGNEKDWNFLRDKIIYSITSANENIPSFPITQISYLDYGKSKSEIEVAGILSLNGITKTLKVKGEIIFNEKGFEFEAKSKISWKDYKIGNPIMWFMRVAKTADPYINLQFHIVAKIKEQ